MKHSGTIDLIHPKGFIVNLSWVMARVVILRGCFRHYYETCWLNRWLQSSFELPNNGQSSHRYMRIFPLSPCKCIEQPSQRWFKVFRKELTLRYAQTIWVSLNNFARKKTHNFSCLLEAKAQESVAIVREDNKIYPGITYIRESLSFFYNSR